MAYSIKFDHPKRIAVILSFYDGMAFIDDQIESILSQNLADNLELRLFIRNDQVNASVTTLNYLEKMKSHSNVEILPDSKGNLGVKNSFLELLNYVDADYYFFSDQDDVWNKDKVSRMINRFVQLEEDKKQPTLVYSDVELVDSTGKKMDVDFGTVVSNRSNNNISHELFHDTVTGAAMAINRSLRDLVIRVNRNDFSTVTMHDSAIAQLAALSGVIDFIPENLVYYRQHDHNTLGIRKQHFFKYSIANLKKKINWYSGHLRQARLMMSLLQSSEIKISDQRLVSVLKMPGRQNVWVALKNGLYLSRYSQGFLNKFAVIIVALIVY